MFYRVRSPACSAMQAVYGAALRAGQLVELYMFYTYVLRSTKDNNLYIGWTDNLTTRIEAHNNGRVDATKYRMPLILIYYEACLDKEAAIRREKQLKTGFGRAYLARRLS